jgi:hypothetical protein
VSHNSTQNGYAQKNLRQVIVSDQGAGYGDRVGITFRDHFADQAGILITTGIQHGNVDVFLHFPGVFSTHALYGMALFGAIPQENEERSEEVKVEQGVVQVAAGRWR